MFSWLNDANPADENVPPKSTKLYDEASIISYLDDDDPVKQIFQYFQLNVEKTISENKENGNPIKVRDDGNTTYKVYLDRKLYTLRFDVFFSEWTGASWGHKVLTDQYRDNKVINEFYGLVNGQYVLLNKDSQGNWTYSGKKTVDYNGPRYKETETNATPQYGIVQGDIVQLTTNVSYQTDGKRRYYLYTGKEHGKYFLVDDAGNNIGSDHHVTWNEAQKVWIRDSNNSITYKCVYTRDNSGTENQDYTGTVYFINADGSFSESGTGNAPYGKISDYYVKLKQKPGEVTWSYNGNRYTGTRYLRTETVTDQSYALGWLEETKELKALSYDASRQQWYYETDDANTTSQYGGTVYFKGVVGGSEQCYVSSITNAKQGGGYEGFLTTGRQSATKSLFSDYDYKAYDVEQGGKYYTVYYLDVTARYGENIYNEWPATYPKQGSYNFVGWIQNDQSKLCLEQYDETKPVGDNNRPSSLKGKYETMSETVRLVRWNGTDFSAKSVEEGIAQEFHCRY